MCVMLRSLSSCYARIGQSPGRFPSLSTVHLWHQDSPSGQSAHNPRSQCTDRPEAMACCCLGVACVCGMHIHISCTSMTRCTCKHELTAAVRVALCYTCCSAAVRAIPLIIKLNATETYCPPAQHTVRPRPSPLAHWLPPAGALPSPNSSKRLSRPWWRVACGTVQPELPTSHDQHNSHAAFFTLMRLRCHSMAQAKPLRSMLTRHAIAGV